MVIVQVAIRDSRRADVAHDGWSFWPSKRRNVRAPETVDGRPLVHAAPDPIRDSDFTSGHGTGVVPARQQIAFTLDEGSWAAWESDRFRPVAETMVGRIVGKVRIRYQGNRIPRGRQGEWGVRTNIARPRTLTYGDQFIAEG